MQARVCVRPSVCACVGVNLGAAAAKQLEIGFWIRVAKLADCHQADEPEPRTRVPNVSGDCDNLSWITTGLALLFRRQHLSRNAGELGGTCGCACRNVLMCHDWIKEMRHGCVMTEEMRHGCVMTGSRK
jgi:hypothetical protein